MFNVEQKERKSLGKLSFYNADGKNLHTSVSYRTFDKNHNLLNDYGSCACFYAFTQNVIPSEIDLIEVYHSLKQIPYSNEIIARWIGELNELGFPCEVRFDADFAYFLVKPKVFTKKFHFNSTLQLIRCLYEYQICYVPEIYFNLISGEKPIDKFVAIQLAHLKLAEYKESASHNSNHMITSAGTNKEPLTRERWQSRLNKSSYGMAHARSNEGWIYQFWSSAQKFLDI